MRSALKDISSWPERMADPNWQAEKFTATRFVPSDMPGVVLYTGEIVFQTSRGEVRCEDAGAYNSDELESGPGPFASVCTITGGTGHWAGATGHIRTHGTFTLAEGGNSQYEGLISH